MGIDELIQANPNFVDCKCTDQNGQVVYRPDNVQSGNECVSECTGRGLNPQIEYYYDYEVRQYPSDGIVRESSQIAFPDARIGERMDKSNHLQMRNDSNTKRSIYALFRGEYGKYFKTRKRPQ